MNARALGLVLIGLVGGACATSGTPTAPPAVAEDYAPLRVGASWTYSMWFQGQTGERTVTVTGQKDGYFIDTERARLKHTPEGLRDPARFLIRNPVEAGQAWKAIVSASAVERYTILSVGEPCTSEAGAFLDCLVVEASLRQNTDVVLRNRFTWARDVGLVKIETEAEIKGKREPQTRQSLIHYRLQGASKDADKASSDTPPDRWER